LNVVNYCNDQSSGTLTVVEFTQKTSNKTGETTAAERAKLSQPTVSE